MHDTKLANNRKFKGPIRDSFSLSPPDQPETIRATDKKPARMTALRRRQLPGNSARNLTANRNQTNWFAAIAGATPSFIKRRDRRYRVFRRHTE